MKLKKNPPLLFKTVGEYKNYNHCRFCFIGILEPVIDLGILPLAGGFIEKKDLVKTYEKNYPLRIGFCNKCKILQTIEVIEATTLFEKYYYSSSKISTLNQHFDLLSEEILSLLKNKKDLVVEIGSNDGILVSKLRKKSVKVLGIDPARNIVVPKIKKGLPMICDYFNFETARKIISSYGKASIITSSNTMAHIENISSVYRGIKELLAPNGIVMVEVHYLKKLIQEFQYDMIYHEHMYYYSVMSMKNILKIFDLELFDAVEISIHAGSIRFYIQHKNGPNKININIANLISIEKKLGLQKAYTYSRFNDIMKSKKSSLLEIINIIKIKSKTIGGYGASGRANTIMCYSGIDNSLLEYVVDDSSLKQGRFTPGSHLEIVNSKILSTKKRPDYILLFAWSFYNEIVKKNSKYIELGGKFIIPLPEIKIIP